ncbi:hypothetical protein [Pseudomonas cichorii]|uniref:Uncharacterized protein n=1 Tax=Pseudomonas cichorii TaxID=36746 RepID=A0ABQ1DIR8_PSECI|nr:hypothetical protein [Pseudomonas cichorii]QVE15705.1 hypothetical protein KGD89_17670 [Pseudomonas cichorii]GFM90814.1 hypothetical protein PSCICP_07860 [Pseudomonas cichorii]SDN32778.1 hypothetical protein SAMN05216599_101634 [Pseudomonas cichorii]
MSRPSTPPHTPQQPAGASIVAGPWPSYANFRHLPERERWEIYSLAKTGRLALEDRGVTMLEPYDDFVWCVCNELEI